MCVGRCGSTAEVNNDILTRWAESMLQRCYKGTSFLLPARCYAQYLLNFRLCAGLREGVEDVECRAL